jgi:hypothetical protein
MFSSKVKESGKTEQGLMGICLSAQGSNNGRIN